MNSKGLEKFITCDVCFETFNEVSRCPRMLSCGHTFCHACIEKILLQSPSCPTCKAQIQSQRAELIPVNFTAKAMIDEFKQDGPNKVQKNSSQESGSNSIPMNLDSVGFCDEHSRFKEFRCMNCENYICSVCGMLKHKQCTTLLIKEANELIKAKVSTRVEQELQLRKFTNESSTQALESLDGERENLLEEMKKNKISLEECEKKIKEIQTLKSDDLKFCEDVMMHKTAVERASDTKAFSKAMDELDTLMIHGKKLLSQLQAFKLISPNAPLTIEAIRKLSKLYPVYVVLNENKLLYGEVTVIEGQICISSFQTEKPKVLLCSFKELFSRFNGPSETPRKAFLKLTGGNEEVTVVIEVKDPNSIIGKAFLKRVQCLDLNGKSYKKRTMYPHDSPDSYGCGSSSLPNNRVRPRMNHSGCYPNIQQDALQDGDVFVTMNTDNHYQGNYPAANTNFYCTTTTTTDEIYIAYSNARCGQLYGYDKIGTVVSGLTKLKRMKYSQLMIQETGLFI